MAVDGLVEGLKGLDFDLVVGTEARGFVFGAPVAYAMNKGFILVRKKGKLPREVISEEYDLEYGSATIEMHTDSVRPGQKVVLVDDLIATGGTADAVVRLIERLGGEIVRMGFVMELEGFGGMERFRKYNPFALITYPGK